MSTVQQLVIKVRLWHELSNSAYLFHVHYSSLISSHSLNYMLFLFYFLSGGVRFDIE